MKITEDLVGRIYEFLYNMGRYSEETTDFKYTIKVICHTLRMCGYNENQVHQLELNLAFTFY